MHISFQSSVLQQTPAIQYSVLYAKPLHPFRLEPFRQHKIPHHPVDRLLGHRFLPAVIPAKLLFPFRLQVDNPHRSVICLKQPNLLFPNRWRYIGSIPHKALLPAQMLPCFFSGRRCHRPLRLPALTLPASDRSASFWTEYPESILFFGPEYQIPENNGEVHRKRHCVLHTSTRHTSHICCQAPDTVCPCIHERLTKPVQIRNSKSRPPPCPLPDQNCLSIFPL